VTADVNRSMLPILDNLERAVSTAPDGVGPLVDGVRIVIAEFHRVLEQHGVRPVAAEGAKFDPSQMEAVLMVPTGEAEENTVLEVFEKGYRTDDLVIRPARVSVAAKKAD
jgi:molecular chaperone GrpE